MLSIATNVTSWDCQIIRHTLPNWLRVFGSRVKELFVLVDTTPLTGRIRELRMSETLALPVTDVVGELKCLAARETRIRFGSIDPLAPEAMASANHWFGGTRPWRCQAGTPILPFCIGIDKARSPHVLHADCDMLFSNCEWLDRCQELLDSGAAHLVEPPRLTAALPGNRCDMSTRAFFLKPATFSKDCLPMRAHQLDLPRRIHRRLHGRPTWLSLEQMLKVETSYGQLRHTVLGGNNGPTMHVPMRAYADSDLFGPMVRAFESGVIPADQLPDWNCRPSAWCNENRLRKFS